MITKLNYEVIYTNITSKEIVYSAHFSNEIYAVFEKLFSICKVDCPFLPSRQSLELGHWPAKKLTSKNA
jgi:hypothetical protein